LDEDQESALVPQLVTEQGTVQQLPHIAVAVEHFAELWDSVQSLVVLQAVAVRVVVAAEVMMWQVALVDVDFLIYPIVC
jgi:hypothetical protein